MTSENEPTIQSLAEGQQKLAEGLQNLTSLVTDFIEEQRQVNEEQRQFNDEMRGFRDEQRQINEEQRQFNDEMRRFRDDQHQFNDEMRGFRDEQRQVNARVDRRLRSIENDIGEIKGGHARAETIRRADIIASAMNLFYERTLSAGELDDMVRENADSAFARNELESFTKADLVIKAKDGSRLTNYIAVEISYTADQRDTGRAIRNAELLTRFTGRPAYAVIASVKNDYAVNDLVGKDVIRWYEIPLRSLQAE